MPERNIKPEDGFAGIWKDRDFPVFSIAVDSCGQGKDSGVTDRYLEK